MTTQYLSGGDKNALFFAAVVPFFLQIFRLGLVQKGYVLKPGIVARLSFLTVVYGPVKSFLAFSDLSGDDGDLRPPRTFYEQLLSFSKRMLFSATISPR